LSDITPEKSTTQLPCEYYSTPASDKRLFPRWVPLSCGTVSLAILIILFTAGAWIGSGGATRVIHWFFGELQTELLGYCDRDVTPAQKQSFTTELATLQARIEHGKVKSDQFLAVIQRIRDVSDDKHVTSSEMDEVTKKVHDANKAQ